MESKLTFQYVQPKDGVTRTYSDSVCVAQSENGLRLTFGERIDVNPERTLIEDRVVVNMTWLEAKRAVEFISSYVAEFERHNGPIREPILRPNPRVTSFIDANGAATIPAPNVATVDSPDQKKVN